MAKTVIEQLLEVLTPEEQQVVKAKLQANPKIAASDRQMGTLFSIYMNDEEPVAPAAAAPAAPAASAVPAAAAAPAAAAPAVAGDNASILAELTKLNTSLAEQKTSFAEFEKKVITVDKIAQYEAPLLEKAIRNAHMASAIERRHFQEFGKELNLDDLAKYIDDQKKTGVGFKNIEDAYNHMTAKEREDKRIEAEVQKRLTQKTSGQAAPGQTLSTNLSPAQQVLQKARAAASKSENPNSTQEIISKLTELERSREVASA